MRDWEEADSVAFPLPKRNVLEFSPRTLSILEITNQRDLEICRKIYDHSFRIGDNAPGWEITYATEFHMTNDSKHFKLREWWEKEGYRPDVFGRWVNDDGDVALPLYEGRMIGQFDFSQKGYVSGRGRSAVWRDIPFDSKAIEPQYLVSEAFYSSWPKAHRAPKVAFMDIASSTNARTTYSVYHSDFPFGHSAPVLALADPSCENALLLTACMNSLCFDFAARQRIGGLHLTWFIVEECPLPVTLTDSDSARLLAFLAIQSARLTLLHRRFAPDWFRLRHRFPELSQGQWKHWWIVTEADRLRCRLEIESVIAHLFGLSPNDFEWILRDDPADPKGFWRVDKNIPKPERYTSLAAAAFRALKEDKWSAESAANLSNDEFFDILGIPEMTNAEAAKAKGESGPLILKRDGCHVWKPENFPEDDPRHGWTWDDCWNDAVDLLGSEEAVREYIEGKPEKSEDEPEPTGPKDLFGDPIIEKPKQRKLL